MDDGELDSYYIIYTSVKTVVSGSPLLKKRNLNSKELEQSISFQIISSTPVSPF